MNKSKFNFWTLWDKAGIYMFFLVVLVIFTVITPSGMLLSTENIMNMMSSAAITGVCAAGMVFAITAGGFDLSVGSTYCITTCVLCIIIPKMAESMPGVPAGVRMVLAILIMAVIAVLMGVVNGLIITKLRIQTFVATLATMVIYRGIAFIITNGKAVMAMQATELKVLSNGWAPTIIMVLVFAGAYVLYKYTRFGVNVRSIGSNESAAKISGVKTEKTLIGVFALTAFTAMLGGLLTTSRLLTGTGRLGNGYELDVIAAVVLGGTSLSGGKGNVWGALIGAVLLTLIGNGLNLLGVSSSYQKLFTGLVLVLALSMGGFREIARQKEIRR